MDRCRPTCWIGCGSWKRPILGGAPELVPLSTATLAPIPHRLPLSAEVLPLSHLHRPGDPPRTAPQAVRPAAPPDPNGISTTPLTISCILNTTTFPMPLPSPVG